MSSITFAKKDLSSLIDHHIALLERFGITDEAPFSIVYFSLEKEINSDNIDTLKKIFRKTDALFKIKGSFIVMLPSTDWNGATKLLSGIQNFLDQNADDNIVTFPDDGKNAKTLLRKLQNLVKDNCNSIIKLT